MSLFKAVNTVVGKTMPSPVTLCAQWNAMHVGFRKSLQASEINGIGKSPIPDGQGSKRIKGGIYYLMSVHKGLPVNGRFRVTGGTKNDRQEQKIFRKRCNI